MIKQYSLFESFNRFVKRLSKYSPEERKRIVDRLIKLGKGNGGIYSADEYGKRMIDGQIKRVKRIADKNGRKLKFLDVKPETSKIIPADDIATLRKPQRYFDGEFDPEEVFNYRNSVRGFDVANLPLRSKPSLKVADITSHEADEYSKMFSNAKHLGISRDKLHALTDIHNKNNRGSHHIGVLRREKNRVNKLGTVYGYESPIERTSEEIKHDSVPLKTLLKYQDYISPKMNEWLSLPPGEFRNMIRLQKQKEVLELLLSRKKKILGMKDSFEKSLALYNLRRDFQRYNNHLDVNRKKLRIDF